MNSRDFQNKLASVTPEVPAHFHSRVEKTLENIVTQEAQMKESTKETIRTAGRFSRRTAVIALALVLILAAAAFAATQWHVFDHIAHLTGEGTPVNADSIMQRDLHTETVNGVEISVREAGYDGRTLLLQYSFRMPDVDRVFSEEEENEGLSVETGEKMLQDHRVGWWIDGLWINGREVNMPGGSEYTVEGSDVPGELIRTDVWRLDNEGVTLNGPVQISLPIGEMQSVYDYTRNEHPEKFNEDGTMKMPEKGMVTFHYNAGDIQAQTQVYHPEQETVLPEMTAKVREAVFTPLMTYIKLDLKVNPEALAAYMEENSEDDEAYAAMVLAEDWLLPLQLTDGEGNLIETAGTGLEAYNGEGADFLYSYQENLPDELWLAPADDESADMSRAVLVRPAK